MRSADPVAPPASCCGQCRHLLRDRHATEQVVVGLSWMGSAYGASIGDSRLCLRLDQWVRPGDGCDGFSPAESH